MHVVQFPWEQPWQRQIRVHTGLHKHFILILKMWEKAVQANVLTFFAD